MINTRDYNKKRFSIFESEEKTALELMNELGQACNEVLDRADQVENLANENKNKKVSYDDLHTKYQLTTDGVNANFNGSWQGLNKPTLSEEGAFAQVEKNMADIVTINEQLDTIDTQILSTKNFDTLNAAILKAQEIGINKIYVDRNFDEEVILPSGISLYSNGSKIKKIKSYGVRGNAIPFSSIGANYVETTVLSIGDIVIIDKPSLYREINKVMYIDNGKTYFESDFLFDYSVGCRVIKITPNKDITLSGLNVDTLDMCYIENLNIEKTEYNKTSRILMTYGLTIDNLEIDSIRDIESRIDIFSCVRGININNVIAVGGNTESDNSNVKLNQIADFNINNLILKSAYKPINKYGYNGYFHNFMIDGAISELLDFIGDDCSYPNYPSKNININNLVGSGSNNSYHSVFLTVVENVNINNIVGNIRMSLKDFKNVNLNNGIIERLLLEGTKSKLRVNNCHIKRLENLNGCSNFKFINTDVDSISGNNNNTSNIKFVNCNVLGDMIQPGTTGLKNWLFDNCYIENIKAIGTGEVDVMLNNVETKLLYLNGVENIIGKNIIVDNSNEPLHWVQNLKNVNIDGIIKNSNTININNAGGLGYNTDIKFKSKTNTYRVSYYLINSADIEYHQTNKSFRYGDIVENRDPSYNLPQRWICIDVDGTLVPLDKIGYQFN